MSERSAKVKQWLKLGLFALTPAAVLLIGSEVWATLTIERTARTEPDPVTGRTAYTMRTGRLPWSRVTVTPLNELGLPDVEFDELPPKGECTHIVFVGDSFVFGDGVDGDSSFVSAFRRSSNDQGPGGCARVFNLGERGTTIDKQSRRLRDTEAVLQPDIVILGQYQNDLADLTVSTAPTDSLAATNRRRLTERIPTSFNLNIVRLLSYHAFATAIRADVHWDLLSRWSLLADTTKQATARSLMNTYDQLYTELATELAAKNIGFGVVIIPSKFDVLAGRFPEESFFVELAERNNVPYLRAFPILDGHRSPYPFLMYDGHLNELGNRLVAEALHDWMYELEPEPFPSLRSP